MERHLESLGLKFTAIEPPMCCVYYVLLSLLLLSGMPCVTIEIIRIEYLNSD